MEQALLVTVREILAEADRSVNVPVLDELTGVYAGRYGVLRLAEEAERALRYRHSLSCFVVELDQMGAIIREHGTARGDCVLQDVGAILRHAVRGTDIVSRLDEERFLLITPRQDAPAALALAERIRQRIARHRFPIPGRAPVAVSAALGAATIGATLVGAEALITRALEALSTAQVAGGNQVVLG